MPFTSQSQKNLLVGLMCLWFLSLVNKSNVALPMSPTTSKTALLLYSNKQHLTVGHNEYGAKTGPCSALKSLASWLYECAALVSVL